jgi:hypothetical protein
MKKTIVLIIIFMLNSSVIIAGDPREIAWIEKGKEAVRSKLKDPHSAQFKNVYFHRGAKGIPVSCGEVNSKNSFGGYIGFQKFISAGNPELTFMQSEVTDFSTSWKQFCK